MTMAVNSVIGLLDPETKIVKFIECYMNGAFDYNGAILWASYSDDIEKVRRLISLGELLSLGDHTSTPNVVKKYGINYRTNPDFQALTPKEKDEITTGLFDYTVAFHRDGKEDAISIFEESIEKYCQRQDYLYLAVPDSEGGVTWYGRGFKGEYHSDTSFHGFEKLEIIIMQLRLIIDQIKNLKELGYNREDAEKFFRKCKYALSDNELNQWVSRHWRI